MLDLRNTKPAQIKKLNDFTYRRHSLLGFILLCMLALLGRAIYLQVINTEFLQGKGNRKHISRVGISAYRGKIVDRNGETLAISTPVQSVWVDPRDFKENADSLKIQRLAEILEVPEQKLIKKLIDPSGKRFFAYLKRRVSPAVAEQVKSLGLAGIYFRREFKRFYPFGEETAHLLGFTSLDDVGQEGLELVYEETLKGVSGSKKVIRDGRRYIIENLESVKEPIPGKDLVLSIDKRLQYLAYHELKVAVEKHEAKAGTLVLLDAKTGDILAAANYPSFNPNIKRQQGASRYRNRAITDVFEPGSTLKPLVIAAALDGGFISPDLTIDTNPGWYRLGRNRVRDMHNYKIMDLTKILKKSSNVATSKIALKMPRKHFWEFYHNIGFGHPAEVNFPGEASGVLRDYRRWNDFIQATLSFGYAVSMSALQLARSYTILADDGILHSVSLLKREQDDNPQQILSADTAVKIRTMLEQVITKTGTAYRARVDGYRVSGKTGTAKKAGKNGYKDGGHLAVFVGMAPASNPRFVMAVMVDEPSKGGYYGGLVAGPVFSKVMAGTLRILGVTPDKKETMPILLEKNDEF